MDSPELEPSEIRSLAPFAAMGPSVPDFFCAAPRWMNFPTMPSSKQLTWIWQGFLASGNVTLLTSQWKTGKTTLLSLLLSRMRTGGTLAGLPVSAGGALVLSEEAVDLWEDRDQRLNLREHVCLLSQPFWEGLTHARWAALLDWIVRVHEKQRLSLVAIDTVASFLPAGVEHNARSAQQCLIGLRRLTQRGMAVLLAHHPRKGVTLPGQSSRGSGALPAYVDILIEMQGYASAVADDRRRRLRSFSRHAQTPRDLVLEWTADGTDYRIPESEEVEEFLQGWQVLRMVLEDAETKLTRRQVLKQWPPDHVKPNFALLWRWLDRAGKRRLVHRDGSGRRNAPFRYWLPGKLEAWLSDPMLVLHNLELYDEVMAAQKAADAAEGKMQEEAADGSAAVMDVGSDLAGPTDSAQGERADAA